MLLQSFCRTLETSSHVSIVIHGIIIIIKRISRVPIYRTRWEHRALYNNINDTHMHAHTLARWDGGDRHSCDLQFRNSY